ncbi:hypothetical protein [Bordetella genomosp. 8]|nr:hypothetical protein [Bordetella genomosp. 8]
MGYRLVELSPDASVVIDASDAVALIIAAGGGIVFHRPSMALGQRSSLVDMGNADIN